MFYYWKRKLYDQTAKAQFAEIHIVDQEAYASSVHVRFATGVEMWFNSATEASFLRELAGC